MLLFCVALPLRQGGRQTIHHYSAASERYDLLLCSVVNGSMHFPSLDLVTAPVGLRFNYLFLL